MWKKKKKLLFLVLILLMLLVFEIIYLKENNNVVKVSRRPCLGVVVIQFWMDVLYSLFSVLIG